MKTKSKISAYILRGSGVALLVSCAIVALSSAISLPNKRPKVSAPQNETALGANGRESAASVAAPATRTDRTLAYADRVAYQQAIEEVYWRHRIWPAENATAKPSLDKVMSQGQIERKVADYLHNSQALEDYWQQPITSEQLQAEMERMAHDTKQPDVLREIFQALRDDPFVIAECLARPALAQRLIAELNNEDRVKLRKVAWLTQPFQSSVAKAKRQAPVTMAALSGNYTLPAISSPSGVCIDDTWTPTTTTNAPSPRAYHTTVWTGSEMIVWGGYDGTNNLNTGGRYNPTTDTWTATSTTNAPDARQLHTAIWTGNEMIVWAGSGNVGFLNTGGRYDPGTDSWTATSLTNAPSARQAHTAVWNDPNFGMDVWGGFNGAPLNTGGYYIPGTDTWISVSTTNAPSPRLKHTAVSTGGQTPQMIIFGGMANGIYLNTGGIYNASTDTWTTVSTTNAPSPRASHTSVWDGLNHMITWGGVANGNYVNTGGFYVPGTDTWTALSTTKAPDARAAHTAVWTGSQMIVWGGAAFPMYFNSGGRYDPGTDSWTATSLINAPAPRAFHTAVWTGGTMIVWGGYDGTNYLNTGGRYCAVSAATPTPTPTPTATATSTATPTATPTPTGPPLGCCQFENRTCGILTEDLCIGLGGIVWVRNGECRDNGICSRPRPTAAPRPTPRPRP